MDSGRSACRSKSCRPTVRKLLIELMGLHAGETFLRINCFDWMLVD